MGTLWGFANTKPFWSWVDLQSGPSSKAGVKVSNSNALSSTAYYSGVTVIAQTLAQVPLLVYKRLQRGKERAYDYQLYKILHSEPNPYMSAYALKETLQGHLLTWGNAFAEVEWEPKGDVVRALWPLRPDCMQVKWQKGSLLYVYTLPNGDTATLSDSNILHIPGFGFDGLIGYDPISLAREAIGLSKATEEFGAKFFSNGSQLSGVLTHPEHLSGPARDNMKKSWNETYQGLSNQHRVAILEEGVTFQQIGVPPENAQFLETREFQVTEIARFLHIPPHMIGHLRDATYSNIEHQGIEFVTYTMTPWFARWEQAINRKLITLADKRDYFSEFMVAGLLRGDSQARAKYYKEMFFMGAMSPNDIRTKENENPVEGGDAYYVPLNMLPVGTIVESPKEGAKTMTKLIETKSAGLLRARTAEAYKRVFISAGDRIVKEEFERLKEKANEYLPAKKNISKKAKSEWLDWLDVFYREFHDTIKALIIPPTISLAEEIQKLALEEVGSDKREDLSKFLDSYSEAFAARYVDSSTGQLKSLMQEDAPLEATETRLSEWNETRAEKVGMNESVQLSNAVARVVFTGAGITRLQWTVTSAKPCPLCQEMNGRIVGIEQNFLDHGASLTTEGRSDFRVYRPTSHPPLHQGCTCQIIPA